MLFIFVVFDYFFCYPEFIQSGRKKGDKFKKTRLHWNWRRMEWNGWGERSWSSNETERKEEWETQQFPQLVHIERNCLLLLCLYVNWRRNPYIYSIAIMYIKSAIISNSHLRNRVKAKKNEEKVGTSLEDIYNKTTSGDGRMDETELKPKPCRIHI